MIKKVIILTAVLLATVTNAIAQDVWQAPEKVQKTEDKAKNEQAKEAKETNNAKTTAKSPKEKKLKIEKKYTEGAIPEVDGKVEWTWTFEMPGRTADQAYQEMMTMLENLTVMPEQTERSKIAAVNPNEHIIAANLVEQMDFSKAVLSHDFTIFRYSLICQTFNGKATVRMCRLVYEYEKGRPTGATYTAEEWITDKECLNKSKTKLYPANGKFRKKTIDRTEDLYKYFDNAIKLKQ